MQPDEVHHEHVLNPLPLVHEVTNLSTLIQAYLGNLVFFTDCCGKEVKRDEVQDGEYVISKDPLVMLLDDEKHKGQAMTYLRIGDFKSIEKHNAESRLNITADHLHICVKCHKEFMSNHEIMCHHEIIWLPVPSPTPLTWSQYLLPRAVVGLGVTAVIGAAVGVGCGMARILYACSSS